MHSSAAARENGEDVTCVSAPRGATSDRRVAPCFKVKALNLEGCTMLLDWLRASENITGARNHKESNITGRTSLFTLSRSNPGVSKHGERASEMPQHARYEYFLKCFHARRDKHLLFGSDTAALSALKLYFYCPWVLFIDSVLSVLPCVSSLMF